MSSGVTTQARHMPFAFNLLTVEQSLKTILFDENGKL